MSITNLAVSYNDFQNDFGQAVNKDYDTQIESLFAPHFKKIANGNALVGERASLKTQLEDVKKMAGKWVIQEKSIIPSHDNKQVTNRYILTSENAGSFEVIAIMSSSDGKHIDLIDEVFYQIS